MIFRSLAFLARLRSAPQERGQEEGHFVVDRALRKEHKAHESMTRQVHLSWNYARGQGFFAAATDCT